MEGTERLKDLAVSDSGFVFDPYTGQSYSVNGTGLAILRALKEGADREAVVAGLAEHFDTGAADLHRDLDEFLHLLRQSGILAPDFDLP